MTDNDMKNSTQKNIKGWQIFILAARFIGISVKGLEYQ